MFAWGKVASSQWQSSLGRHTPPRSFKTGFVVISYLIFNYASAATSLCGDLPLAIRKRL